MTKKKKAKRKESYIETWSYGFFIGVFAGFFLGIIIIVGSLVSFGIWNILVNFLGGL